jgi:hypothetical protein
MPIDLTISQAVVVSDPSGPTLVAKSDAFPFEREEAVLAVVRGFGTRPPAVAVPAAMFATPLGRGHVAVVQVADQPGSTLGFRFLVLTRRLYEAIGDPFVVTDRFPPNWSARGSLPTLDWPPEPIPLRTAEQVARILKDGDGPLLLGATQGLLDGVRLVLARSTPDDATLRALWHLLPARTRIELWPATFAFTHDLGFHVAVMPNPPAPLPLGYVSEEQAKDYPQGRYELALQTAAEHGDQGEIDRLFTRRSSKDTLRLALLILAGAMIAVLVSKLVM